MNRTKELLTKLKAAILDGRLAAADIPIADIKRCVTGEVRANAGAFTSGRYEAAMESLRVLCDGVSDTEQDRGKILLWLDALILCVDMISPEISTCMDALFNALRSGEYWRYKHRDRLHDPEIMEIIDYIEKEHRAGTFNYAFVKEYDDLPVEVGRDEGSGMLYVPYKGRRMFFPRSWDEQKIITYYREIAREQDARSPHCYGNTAIGGVRAGDVVVDAGTAEGNFALDVIDRAGKIYLIEADGEWIEPLGQTFREDGGKVQIVQGFLGDTHGGDCVSIDGLFGQEEIHFIKMDIEGAEKPALLGAAQTLQRSKDFRCAICAYHHREDEAWIRGTLEKYGFETETSRGYMWMGNTVEDYVDAQLRRALVFGRKCGKKC